MATSPLNGRLALLLLTVALFFSAAAASAQTAAVTACENCHRDQRDARLATPAHDFAGSDVHRDRGFTCVDCHGGNPNEPDKVKAKAPATGFKGKPAGQQVIAVCSRCHSDGALMRKFAPKQRIDQAAEYATSVHGQQLAKGDTKVATCISCHGAHGVRLVSDAKAPVYVTNVATTCAQVPLGWRAHEGLQAAGRIGAADRPARKVRAQRAPCGDGQAQRSIGADLQ